MTITIRDLFIYPVKSLRGFSVQSAKLCATGLEYDRQWMVINEKNLFVTQRKYGQMILVHTEIRDQQLILTAPKEKQLPPLVIDINTPPEGDRVSVTVWKDTWEAQVENEQANQWITQAVDIGIPLRLVRMTDQQRPQSKPDLLGESTHTGFADAAPILVTNTASLEAINQQMQQAGFDEVTMENFRPNIVLDGLDKFEEHSIEQLSHSNYQLKFCYPCQRCVMPTIDVNTGIRHPKQQPFTLISEINAMPDNPKAPAFGENAIVLSGEGQAVQIGDEFNLSAP